MNLKALIAKTVVVVGLIALLAVAVGMSRNKDREERCKELVCKIADKDERSYVSEQELFTLLKQHNAYPVGEYLHRINLQHMENIIRQHPMVRTAECYTAEDGTARIRITQRVPLLKVVTADEAYYIDTDRRKMPMRASIQDTVPQAVGRVGFETASTVLADFAEWVLEDDYWRARVSAIDVRSPKQIYIKQKGKQEDLVLGDLTDYEGKLQKAALFYRRTASVEKPRYRALDLRYRKQVVAVR
ncbi:MAG: cell division protein FtsQ/DivIB [Paludibacteraceae bacterium]